MIDLVLAERLLALLLEDSVRFIQIEQGSRRNRHNQLLATHACLLQRIFALFATRETRPFEPLLIGDRQGNH